MATAPRRTTKVPGAKTEEIQTTAQNAEDALNAILGSDTAQATPIDPEPVNSEFQATHADETAPAPEEDPEGLAEYEEFLRWRRERPDLKATPAVTAPVYENQTKPAEKQYRKVLTKDGWTREEI
ncbi:hypothetical protein IL972_00390 [Acinetobacter sp. FL51]|uniref:hypothetical protein n=1 Tax=Acinetobacter sp. FL51 TaxID=2777978 RepID=UPI0018E10907|nr:hypothetical protein [Acinetobacter sp. FL51]MBI1450396.1 hypothetical protein [Acinetobacter sp. FL51]